MNEAVHKLREVLDQVVATRPGVLDIVEFGDDLIITETFEPTFSSAQVEELALLQHHDDDTWTLHVLTHDEWEVSLDLPSHQPFDVILAELRDDPSNYFWG
ncbi:MAG: DUF3024 domain-containing protein [Acidimicrobiales bacterium]